MKYFIGADLGTSALKLLLVKSSGEIIKTAVRFYSVYYPNAGWSEQNPEDWWNAFLSGVKELVQDINPAEIAGIGVAGQMHGLIVLDKDDAVIRPAILWNDGRTNKETAYLNEVVGKEKLSKLTANIAFAGFTAPKILWLKNNEPENFSKICKIMLPKDYINYKLTGVHCTDYSDASGMLLLDVKNKDWSQEMFNICDISENQMPKLFESFETVGTVLPHIASELKLNANTVVVAGAGDNAAAAIGTGTVTDGKCNISLGTSGTVFISSNEFTVDGNNALHSFCHASGEYHLMACILSAASCNKWFCEGILKTEDYAVEQNGITDNDLGKNDVFFLPYLMGERSPINDTDARGVFVGLCMNTTRADMVQAVLEGVAFAIRDNMEIARAQGINITSSSLCGGGAKSELWQKILCNILNVEVLLLQTEQGPGYGAAMLAMVGCGEFANPKECADKFVKLKKTITPNTDISLRYEERYKKFKEIYPTVKTLYKKLI
ncbi:MAG: xylulokinase [Ruminococcaceae bacterium]|nr:xylulokinase [Oscillospiraceae bacterium]